MWSINLNALITKEYQTVGGYSVGLQSNWDLKWQVQEYHGTDCNMIESTWKHRQQVWECRQHAWERVGVPATWLEAPATSLGAHRITLKQTGKNDNFGNVAWAHGNHSYNTSFHDFQNTCVWFAFSHTYLYTYPSTHSRSILAAAGAWEQFVVCLKMTIELTQRYTSGPWSRDFGDEHAGNNRVYLEIHSKAVIERV